MNQNTASDIPSTSTTTPKPPNSKPLLKQGPVTRQTTLPENKVAHIYKGQTEIPGTPVHDVCSTLDNAGNNTLIATDGQAYIYDTEITILPTSYAANQAIFDGRT